MSIIFLLSKNLLTYIILILLILRRRRGDSSSGEDSDSGASPASVGASPASWVGVSSIVVPLPVIVEGEVPLSRIAEGFPPS